MYQRIERVLLAVIIITVVTTVTAAYQPGQKENAREVGGVISGRVTSDGQPVRGVVVFIQPSDISIGSVKIRARTDQTGHFEVRGVAAGTYFLQAFAPALVVSTVYPTSQGKVVNLRDNEVVDSGELQLKQGGVIAGRVYDVDGKPLVQETIRIFRAEANRKEQLYLPYGYMFLTTDDRGAYRIFGVPPGKYLVSIGVEPGSPIVRINAGNTYHPITFHPDTSDESKAAAVEIGAGTEATGIDIIVGKAARGYSVSGRVIDATTGKPVAGLMYGYSTYDPQSNRVNSSSPASSTSNSRGEFRIDGLAPGKYATFVYPRQDSEIYSELSGFTITDSDISGITIKVLPGSTITGNIIIEGTDGLPDAPRPAAVKLNVFSDSMQAAPRSNQVEVAADGSFRTTGLGRGIAVFSLAYPIPKGLTIDRIERDGVDQKDGFNVGAGEEISGVKIILSYGTGAIRGQLQVEGGDISQNTLMFINLRRIGAQQPIAMRMPIPDVRGRFLIEGLVPGEYELSVYIQLRSEEGKPARSKTVNQKVSVTNGNETQVTMPVDFNSNDR